MYKNRKILLIHFCRFPPTTGGEYVYFKIYQALRKKFDVTNISTTLLYDRFRSLSERKALRHIIDPISILYPLFVKRSYDLIFTSWSCEVPFFGNVVYAQPPTGSLANFPKGCTFSTYGRTKANAFGVGITWPWRKIFGSFSINYHTFISCGKAVKSFIKHQFNKESIVIYPPVPTQHYNVKGITKKDIVLSIGRVDPTKRFDLISMIGTKIPEAKFILIGSANVIGKKIVKEIKDEFTKAGLEDNFEYLGRVSESVKRDLLLQSKVLFHPAPYESFSVTIVEGLAAGTIPVAHNSGGTPEAIPPRWLFTNVDEAIEKVRYALDENLTVRREMKEMAYKYNEKRFEDEILNVINNLISRV